ncbi:MAG: DUF2634 domain-containing protein [Clostridia bacterium]|nr:DUF2634 domain-containing protein [Clostridia bacterium]
MLPERDLKDNVEKATNYKAYKLDFENKRIDGIIDGKEALEQAVRLMLMTERYKYPAFSHSYGTDYSMMFSESEKAMGRLKNAICDSLESDERILAVDNFSFERRGSKMLVNFTVLSVYGAVNNSFEVT